MFIPLIMMTSVLGTTTLTNLFSPGGVIYDTHKTTLDTVLLYRGSPHIMSTPLIYKSNWDNLGVTTETTVYSVFILTAPSTSIYICTLNSSTWEPPFFYYQENVRILWLHTQIDAMLNTYFTTEWPVSAYYVHTITTAVAHDIQAIHTTVHNPAYQIPTLDATPGTPVSLPVLHLNRVHATRTTAVSIHTDIPNTLTINRTDLYILTYHTASRIWYCRANKLCYIVCLYTTPIPAEQVYNAITQIITPQGHQYYFPATTTAPFLIQYTYPQVINSTEFQFNFSSSAIENTFLVPTIAPLYTSVYLPASTINRVSSVFYHNEQIIAVNNTYMYITLYTSNANVTLIPVTVDTDTSIIDWIPFYPLHNEMCVYEQGIHYSIATIHLYLHCINTTSMETTSSIPLLSSTSYGNNKESVITTSARTKGTTTLLRACPPSISHNCTVRTHALCSCFTYAGCQWNTVSETCLDPDSLQMVETRAEVSQLFTLNEDATLYVIAWAQDNKITQSFVHVNTGILHISSVTVPLSFINYTGSATVTTPALLSYQPFSPYHISWCNSTYTPTTITANGNSIPFLYDTIDIFTWYDPHCQCLLIVHIVPTAIRLQHCVVSYQNLTCSNVTTIPNAIQSASILGSVLVILSPYGLVSAFDLQQYTIQNNTLYFWGHHGTPYTQLLSVPTATQIQYIYNTTTLSNTLHVFLPTKINIYTFPADSVCRLSPNTYNVYTSNRWMSDPSTFNIPAVHNNTLCVPLQVCNTTTEYEATPPTLSTDRICKLARTCTSGTLVTPHTNTTDTRCSSSSTTCALLCATQTCFWQSENDCVVRTTCSIQHTSSTDLHPFQFNRSLTYQNNTDTILNASLSIYTADRQCVPVTTCLRTQYQLVPPTPTTDRVCAPTTLCAPGSRAYILQPATPTSDRVCGIDTRVCTDTEYDRNWANRFSVYLEPTRDPHPLYVNTPHYYPAWCTPHTQCVNMSVMRPGTVRTDAVCGHISSCFGDVYPLQSTHYYFGSTCLQYITCTSRLQVIRYMPSRPLWQQPCYNVTYPQHVYVQLNVSSFEPTQLTSMGYYLDHVDGHIKQQISCPPAHLTLNRGPYRAHRCTAIRTCRSTQYREIHTGRCLPIQSYNATTTYITQLQTPTTDRTFAPRANCTSYNYTSLHTVLPMFDDTTCVPPATTFSLPIPTSPLVMRTVQYAPKEWCTTDEYFTSRHTGLGRLITQGTCMPCAPKTHQSHMHHLHTHCTRHLSLSVAATPPVSIANICPVNYIPTANNTACVLMSCPQYPIPQYVHVLDESSALFVCIPCRTCHEYAIPCGNFNDASCKVSTTVTMIVYTFIFVYVVYVLSLVLYLGWFQRI